MLEHYTMQGCSWRILCWSLIAGLASSANLVVHLDKPAQDFPHYWKRCVGSGHMLLATRSDYQEHLKQARRDLGFERVRGHGILNDDMSVEPELGRYEFFNVDVVYDFFLSIGIQPIVELSFLPKALSSCEGKVCHYAFHNQGAYKGLVMPPDNYADWYNLVHALATHLVDRYGINEVSQWRFEVWNEQWGVKFPDPYMQLYKTSVDALKAVSPRLLVGGPASMQTLYVADFIKAATEQAIPFDFVSTHLYPTDPQCGPNNVTCFERMILAGKDAVKKHNPKTEYLITEYNAGLFLREDVDLDSSASAAFIFRQIAALDGVDMLSWWTFSDIFEELWMNADPFQGAYGLMTNHGVPKPSWRAFELLAAAGTKRLHVRGPAAPMDPDETLIALATLDEDKKSLQIFVGDWQPPQAKTFSCDKAKGKCMPDAKGKFTDRNVCDADCNPKRRRLAEPQADTDSVTVEIIVQMDDSLQVALGGQGATIARIDNEHANAKALWVQWNRPKYLTSKQIAELKNRSTMQEEAVQVQLVNQTVVSLKVSIMRSSAARIHIPLEAVGSARSGLGNGNAVHIIASAVALIALLIPGALGVTLLSKHRRRSVGKRRQYDNMESAPDDTENSAQATDGIESSSRSPR